TQRGEGRNVLRRQAEPFAAEARPAGERRGPAARDEDRVAGTPERARAGERLRRLAVQQKDRAVRELRRGESGGGGARAGHGQRRARAEASASSRSSGLSLQTTARSLPPAVRGTSSTSSSSTVISP